MTEPELDPRRPAPDLAVALIDVESVSGGEARLAGMVEAALGGLAHLEVVRDGQCVLARTALGRPTRVVLAGHLDTVPVAGNVPARVEDGVIHGCGAADMKSGVAVMLRLAAALAEPAADLTFVFYDCEEIEDARNGLRRMARERRPWLDADLAILLEPTDGRVEAGCQGTLRAEVRTAGRRAHSARSWLGENAIHGAAPVLALLAGYRPRSVELDGCTYREGLNAVRIAGGVAGNVIPDECVVSVNYRFAPDRDEAAAFDHVREVFSGYQVDLVDSAPGAPPGLREPAALAFLSAVGTAPVAKYGWTDVARFASLGIAALNYGPGDPNLAHTREEHVRAEQIIECEQALTAYLTG